MRKLTVVALATLLLSLIRPGSALADLQESHVPTLPLFSLQVPLFFDLSPTLNSPPSLPSSNVIIENSTFFTLGSFAPDGSILDGDAALVIFIQNPSSLIERVAVHADPSIRIDANNTSASGTILAGASGGGTTPSDFMIGNWRFEIDFVKAATVGDTGSFDVALALLDHRATPLASVPGVSFEMDVQLGSTNTDRGTKFPQATIGGAVISVPEPSTLALVGAAMVSLCFAHTPLKRWRAKRD